MAAAALIAAQAASAQGMKASVPFAFQAGGKVMAAGTYQVDFHGLGGTLMIRNSQRNVVVTALPTTRIEAKDESAKLVFACGHGACSLVQAWPGESGAGRLFHAPKFDRNEEASLTVIRLRPDAGE